MCIAKADKSSIWFIRFGTEILCRQKDNFALQAPDLLVWCCSALLSFFSFIHTFITCSTLIIHTVNRSGLWPVWQCHSAVATSICLACLIISSTADSTVDDRRHWSLQKSLFSIGPSSTTEWHPNGLHISLSFSVTKWVSYCCSVSYFALAPLTFSILRPNMSAAFILSLLRDKDRGLSFSMTFFAFSVFFV